MLQTGGVPAPGEQASRLLLGFGCINQVLSASWRDLLRIGGWRTTLAIKRVPATRRQAIRRQMDRRPLFRSVRCLERFVADYSVERNLYQDILVVYIDSGNRLVTLSSVGLKPFAGDTIDVASLIATGRSMGAAGFFILRQGEQRARSGSFLSLLSRTYVADSHVPLMQQFRLPPGHVGFIEQCGMPT